MYFHTRASARQSLPTAPTRADSATPSSALQPHPLASERLPSETAHSPAQTEAAPPPRTASPGRSIPRTDKRTQTTAESAFGLALTLRAFLNGTARCRIPPRLQSALSRCYDKEMVLRPAALFVLLLVCVS